MAIEPRKICCDVCTETATEPEVNAGWLGWGHLAGINFNGADNPTLCPNCLARVAEFLDYKKESV